MSVVSSEQILGLRSTSRSRCQAQFALFCSLRDGMHDIHDLLCFDDFVGPVTCGFLCQLCTQLIDIAFLLERRVVS
jgi:hypothetical protein